LLHLNSEHLDQQQSEHLFRLHEITSGLESHSEHFSLITCSLCCSI
jgi:hypothetical protein